VTAVRVRVLLVPTCIALVVLLGPGPVGAAKVCAWSIPVEMVSKVFSGNARAGYGFKYRVTADAAAEDGTKIPAGTIGYGVIRGASAAGRRNRDGTITLEPRYLVVPKPRGDMLHLEVTMNPTLPVTWSPSEPLLNRAASHVPLPIPGLIITGINQVRWGRNITLGPGFAFTVLPVLNIDKAPVC
jgi:hypothetical protein